MGFLLTLLLALIFGSLGLIKPRVGFYIIVGLIVFFEEMGLGFTTFRGSWVFNAYFVGFYGIRLIEVLTISLYIPFLLTLKPAAGGSIKFNFERNMAIIFIVWCALLTALEYFFTRKIEVASWRLLVSGMMQFHMLIRLFNTEETRMRLLKILLVMLAARAFIGLVVYATGGGIHSPRGRVPFFYDSKQIEAFALGAIILWSFLLNLGAVKRESRPLSVFIMTVMLIVLLATVALSIRRTIWVSTAAGLILVLILSRRTTVIHYFWLALISAITVAALLLAPGLDDFRSHMGKYVRSMNLFSDYQLYGNVENDVHINNIESYSRMLLENPDIVLVGVHGPSSENYQEMMRDYSEGGYRLGMAHNGPLRSLVSFGVVGLLGYFAIFFVILRRTYKVHRAKKDDNMFNHAAIACGVVLTLDFSASMLFVPPFYTSSKGLFYTFFAMFILGSAALQLGRQPRAIGSKGSYESYARIKSTSVI